MTYTMIVGASNSGKSNLLAALRLFFEGVKWSAADDVPKVDMKCQLASPVFIPKHMESFFGLSLPRRSPGRPRRSRARPSLKAHRRRAENATRPCGRSPSSARRS